MKNPEMTLSEVVSEMRAVGFRTSPTRVAANIECGKYPFGSISSTGSTGRRQFQILRVEFERWLKEVTGE